MPFLLLLAGLLLGFVAASGFLFGQVFAGKYMVGACLAGLGGIGCAIAALRMAVEQSWSPTWVRMASAITLLGVALDAAQYYQSAAMAGNYYGWGLIAPFALCAAGVAWVSSARRRRGTEHAQEPT